MSNVPSVRLDLILCRHTLDSNILVLGSQAWGLTESNRPEGTPSDHTKGWKVYVKGTENGPDITTWLKKAQFKLHHTYANNTRSKFLKTNRALMECLAAADSHV